jgi:hypothetical protein
VDFQSKGSSYGSVKPSVILVNPHSNRQVSRSQNLPLALNRSRFLFRKLEGNMVMFTVEERNRVRDRIIEMGRPTAKL